MASFNKHSLLLFALLNSLILLSHPVSSSDDEDNLLQGLNSYRNSLSLPSLTKNDKAGCLADEIADDLEDHSCTPMTSTSSAAATATGTQIQVSNYPKQINKCKINATTTSDGVVLPVCVPKLVPTLVLTNYTRSPYARYLNDSRYTGVGIGSEDDWMVVVLSTNTPTGSFSGAPPSVVSNLGFGLGRCSLLLGLVVVFLI